LIRQLEVDLQKFIVATLRLGIQARAEKLGQAIALISEEEKNAESFITTKNPLAEAQVLLKQEKLTESLFVTIAIIERTLRQTLENQGVTTNATNTFADMVALAKEFDICNKESLKMLRTASIYRNQVVHMALVPNKEQTHEFLENARLLINELSIVSDNKTNNKKSWNPLPVIKFNIMGLPLKRKLPQVGWELENLSPYQLKVRIEVHPWLGNRDLFPEVADPDISGKKAYNAEPNHLVWGNGTFTLPKECASSNEDLILEIRSFVTDANEPKKNEYKMLSSTWKYVRDGDYWYYYPQGP
jgi:hypothetical protein